MRIRVVSRHRARRTCGFKCQIAGHCQHGWCSVYHRDRERSRSCVPGPILRGSSNRRSAQWERISRSDTEGHRHIAAHNVMRARRVSRHGAIRSGCLQSQVAGQRKCWRCCIGNCHREGTSRGIADRVCGRRCDGGCTQRERAARRNTECDRYISAYGVVCAGGIRSHRAIGASRLQGQISRQSERRRGRIHDTDREGTGRGIADRIEE